MHGFATSCNKSGVKCYIASIVHGTRHCLKV